MDLNKLVKYDSGMEFKGSDFMLLMGPVVYVFFEEDTPIYVGMSRNGITRPADKGHHRMKNQRFTSVKIWACKGVGAATELEAHLIAKLNPTLNRRPGSRVKRTRSVAKILGLADKTVSRIG